MHSYRYRERDRKEGKKGRERERERDVERKVDGINILTTVGREEREREVGGFLFLTTVFLFHSFSPPPFLSQCLGCHSSTSG